MYDLNDLTGTQDKVSVDGSRKWWEISEDSFIGYIFGMVKSVIKIRVLQYILFIVGTFLIMFFTGDMKKSKEIADNMATEGSRENFLGLFSEVEKAAGYKNTATNSHPFYHTTGARKLELKFEKEFGHKIKLSSLFSYQKLNGEDFLVMKSAARGKNKERLSLDNWTIIGMSANDYCEDYFDGFLPDEEMMQSFIKSWRVRTIKNKEDQNRFRCVIGPDTIEEYIEDDRKD